MTFSSLSSRRASSKSALGAELDVDEREIRLELGRSSQRLRTDRRNADHVETLPFEESAGGVQEVRAVVDDEAAQRHAGHDRLRPCSRHSGQRDSRAPITSAGVRAGARAVAASARHPAPHRTALVLGQPAPDAGVLTRVQRPSQAGVGHVAAAAHLFPHPRSAAGRALCARPERTAPGPPRGTRRGTASPQRSPSW